MPAWVQLLAFSAGAATLYAGAVAVWKGSRALWKGGRRISQFLNDWFGEEPRPGLPDGRPGVLARLDAIEDLGRSTAARVDVAEQRLAAVEGQIAAVEAQLRPNGGKSLRDAVDRLHPKPSDETADPVPDP